MNKKLTLKQKVITAIVGVLLAASSYLVGQLKEKPLGGVVLDRSCSTGGTASTTLVSLGAAGTATTSMDCLVGRSEVLRVNAWLVASSTDTHYRFLVARSSDLKDYYQDGGSLLSLNVNATTTQLNSFTELGYKFASSTKETQINVNFSGTGTTSAKLITFEIPSRGADSIRITTYLQTSKINGLATTSDSGMFWMEGVRGAEK